MWFDSVSDSFLSMTLVRLCPLSEYVLRSDGFSPCISSPKVILARLNYHVWPSLVCVPIPLLAPLCSLSVIPAGIICLPLLLPPLYMSPHYMRTLSKVGRICVICALRSRLLLVYITFPYEYHFRGMSLFLVLPLISQCNSCSV